MFHKYKCNVCKKSEKISTHVNVNLKKIKLFKHNHRINCQYKVFRLYRPLLGDYTLVTDVLEIFTHFHWFTGSQQKYYHRFCHCSTLVPWKKIQLNLLQSLCFIIRTRETPSVEMKGTVSGSAVLQIETNTLLKLCDLLKSLILFYLRREASRMLSMP